MPTVIGKLPSGVITGEDIGRNTPNPDIFLKATFNLVQKPQERLVVKMHLASESC